MQCFFILEFVGISPQTPNLKQIHSSSQCPTVTKNRDLLKLLVQGWIYEVKTHRVAMVSFLLGFFLIGNAS